MAKSSGKNGKNGKTRVSRRDFLKLSAEVGVGTLAFAGCTSLGTAGRKLAGQMDSSPTEIYDYVVVGSGAGGGPLACRLALAGKSVALIEAGSDYKKDVNYEVDKYTPPAFHPLASEEIGMTWTFWVNHYANQAQAVRDTANYNATEHGILYPRAGTLGGCTAHNALFILYPDAEDWQRIYNLTVKSGKPDPTWQPNNMIKYFRRMENCQYWQPPMKAKVLQTVHGWNGWLSTEMSNFAFAFQDSKIRDYALAAARANGDQGVFEFLSQAFPKGLDPSESLDPNSEPYIYDKKNGLFIIPKSSLGGKRRGPREFINQTAQAHPDKLTVKKNHFVSELIFDATEITKAVGVFCYTYASDKPLYSADPRAKANPDNVGLAQTTVVKARKEVILAGGTFNTPQLLMLSGIGDSNVLEPILAKTNRRPRVHLPGVGKNLQDRYEVGVVTQVDSDFTLTEKCNPGELPAQDPCLADYLKAIGPKDPVTGEEMGNANSVPYSSNGAVVALIRRSFPNKTAPDLCIFGVPGYFTGYRTGYSKQAYAKNCFTWTILKGHTENTAGTVTLASASPFDQPVINFHSFDEGSAPNGDDADCVVEAIKYVRDINSQGGILDVDKNGYLGVLQYQQKPGSGELVPGKNIDNDIKLKQWVKDSAWGHHASCSNKMGVASDPNTVVDTDFRVLKTQRLRIVDASVFPRVPGLYIVSSIYMISEKAADTILADYDQLENNFL